MSVIATESSRKREQDTTEYSESNRGTRIIRIPISEEYYKILISDRKIFISVYHIM